MKKFDCLVLTAAWDLSEVAIVVVVVAVAAVVLILVVLVVVIKDLACQPYSYSPGAEFITH